MSHDFLESLEGINFIFFPLKIGQFFKQFHTNFTINCQIDQKLHLYRWSDKINKSCIENPKLTHTQEMSNLQNEKKLNLKIPNRLLFFVIKLFQL